MLWQYWQEEWLLSEKVEFDGINKLILIHPEVTSLDIRSDVYSAWVRWLPLQLNTQFLPAMRFSGLDQIPGGVTGDTYFLINGWKFLVDLRKVAITGVLFSDDYDTAYYDYDTSLPLYPTKVSALVNTVNISGGTSGPTATQIRQEIDNNSVKLAQIKAKTDTITESPTAVEIASAVRTELGVELSHVLTLQNGMGLDYLQATMLLEIYRMYGLDPSKPLVVTQTNRSAGSEITQTITGNESVTTITRV